MGHRKIVIGLRSFGFEWRFYARSASKVIFSGREHRPQEQARTQG